MIITTFETLAILFGGLLLISLAWVSGVKWWRWHNRRQILKMLREI